MTLKIHFFGNCLANNWIACERATVEDGVLSFAPPEDVFQLVTKRNDFGDISMTADVRICRQRNWIHPSMELSRLLSSDQYIHRLLLRGNELRGHQLTPHPRNHR